MAWVLILTLAGVDGASIYSVPNFGTKGSCIEAGKKWKSRVFSSRQVASYVCVERQ